MNAFRYVAMAVIAALCVACAPSPAPSPSQTQPSTSLDSPLTSPVPTPRPLPTQDPTLGSIKGSLFGGAGAARFAARDVVLFLGNIVQGPDGKEGIVSLDRITAPRADVNADGTFTFVNVPPGRYGLTAEVDTLSLLLNKPADGTEFIITVEAGKQTDLGELVYPDLPPLK
jgi:hypothetical protein